MTILIDYYDGEKYPMAERMWFTHLWVARDGQDAIGFMTTSWEGKIMLVGVEPARRRGGIPGLLLRAAAARFPGGLTHGYPISKAGQRFVARHQIRVHEVDAGKGFEPWPDEEAEQEAHATLEIIRGRGSTPFPTAPTSPATAPEKGFD